VRERRLRLRADERRSPAQWFCLIGGGLLLIRGLVGVALDPTFETPGEGWHQFFHLASGAALLVVSRSVRPALALTLAFATVYAGATVAGILDGHDVLGVLPIEASDTRIHLTLTLIALAAGLATLVRRSPPGIQSARGG
jgi:hypothetical protein